MKNRNRKMRPEDRKAQILEAGVLLSEKHNYLLLQGGQVAADLGIALGLPFMYFGTTDGLRKSVMKEAIRTNNVTLIMQMMANREKIVKKAPPEILKRAAELLGEPYGLRN